MSIRVLDPRAGESARSTVVAPAVESIEGRTIGLLDNSKFNVRDLLDQIEIILKERYGVARVVRLRKPDPSRPVPPDVRARFQECDAVVSAVGD
ncbi:MAG TPA: hypothetical protein VHL09_12955 [Dehalococcoidia bacterium]|nr:hypothetical protein [Dehalococcoidia bacterium]